MVELLRPNNVPKLPPDGPAIFANVSHLVANPGSVRIVFLEAIVPGAEAKFRSAVIMPMQDVMSLKNALVQVCAQLVQVQPPAELNVS